MEFIVFIEVFIALAIVFAVAAAVIGPANFMGKVFIVLTVFCLTCSVVSAAFSEIYTEKPVVGYYERK